MGLVMVALAAISFVVTHSASKTSLTSLQMENIEAISDKENTNSEDCPPPSYRECYRVLIGNRVLVFYENE